MHEIGGARLQEGRDILLLGVEGSNRSIDARYIVDDGRHNIKQYSNDSHQLQARLLVAPGLFTHLHDGLSSKDVIYVRSTPLKCFFSRQSTYPHIGLLMYLSLWTESRRQTRDRRG